VGLFVIVSYPIFPSLPFNYLG